MKPLVRQLAPGLDDDALVEFLRRHRGATLYHTPRYRDLVAGICGGEPVYLGTFEGGSLTGLLPAMRRAGPWGTVLNSLPFFGSYGDLLYDTDAAAEALSDAWSCLCMSPGVASSTVIENPFAPLGLSLTSTGPTEGRTAQWTPLPAATDGGNAILAIIDGSARRNVRKAQTSGVTVVPEGDLRFLRETHLLNMAEIGGNPKPDSFFSLIPAALRIDDDFRIYTAYQDGRPVAAILLFYFGSMVEYITPVTIPGARDVQPTAEILFRAMCDAVEQGRTIWNWGGTWDSQSGVYRFKKKWGAHEKPYCYRTVLNNRGILDAPLADLQRAYPNFYVYPYGWRATRERPGQ